MPQQPDVRLTPNARMGKRYFYTDGRASAGYPELGRYRKQSTSVPPFSVLYSPRSMRITLGKAVENTGLS